jgi:hypothetical protein
MGCRCNQLSTIVHRMQEKERRNAVRVAFNFWPTKAPSRRFIRNISDPLRQFLHDTYFDSSACYGFERNSAVVSRYDNNLENVFSRGIENYVVVHRFHLAQALVGYELKIM